MRIRKYEAEDFALLSRFAARIDKGAGLSHRSFVDHYYLGHERGRLWLALEDEEIIATVGVERMPFILDGRQIDIAIGTNFHSIAPGAGGHLFVHWVRSGDYGMVFGGSPDTRAILERQNWDDIEGVEVLRFNWPFVPNRAESSGRLVSKWLVSNLGPKRKLDPEALRSRLAFVPPLRAVEERDFSEALFSSGSGFRLRLAPDLPYLGWRYSTRLPFARYRLFRLVDPKDRSFGYVVLNVQKERVIVAHADGPEAGTLAYGILVALEHVMKSDVAPRGVLLAAAHWGMKRFFRRAGFVPVRAQRPLSLGRLGRGVDFSTEAMAWQVSYGWGDNDLRPPFLDEA